MTDQPRFVPVPVSMQHPTPVGKGTTEPGLQPGRHFGRPSGLTADMESRIVTALRNSGNLKLACEYVGVSHGTVLKWIQRGEGKDSDRPATAEYVRFARLIRENRAAAQLYATGNLLAQSAKRPKAATDYLDVYGPDEWKEARREIRERGAAYEGTPTQVNVATQVNVGLPSGEVREQNLTVIEIPTEKLPDFLRSLIAQSREERAHAVEEIHRDDVEETIPDGHRSPRLAPLRITG